MTFYQETTSCFPLALAHNLEKCDWLYALGVTIVSETGKDQSRTRPMMRSCYVEEFVTMVVVVICVGQKECSAVT